MKRTAPRLPSIGCPHCGGGAFARSAGKTATTFREVYYYCRDRLGCGHTFIVEMSITRTIAPSLCPNPNIILPIAPPEWIANNRSTANDNKPPQFAEMAKDVEAATTTAPA